MKFLSPISDHHNTTGHDISIDNFSIVGREDQNLARSIKEAIFIRLNDPSLNRNIGKYQLLHIWDEILVNSHELKFTDKPKNLQDTSVTYMMVLYTMNHNKQTSLITS